MLRSLRLRSLRSIAVTAIALVFLGMLGAFLSQRGPSYHGKPLGYWIDALTDEDPSIREEAIQVLVQALKDRDSTVRALAAFNLGRATTTDYSVSLSLANTLDDDDVQVRKSAIMGLMLIQPKHDNVIPMLLGVLKREDDPEVKYMAFKALLHLGSHCKIIIGDLVAMFGDDNPDTRCFAVWILGSIGEDGAGVLPELNRIAKEDKELRVQRAALEAIRMITKGKENGPSGIVTVQ